MTKKVKYLSSILAPVSIGELIDIKTSLPNINLENQAKFEKQHPTTFRAMYQFWVCKRKIEILQKHKNIFILQRRTSFYDFFVEIVKKVFGKHMGNVTLRTQLFPYQSYKINLFHNISIKLSLESRRFRYSHSIVPDEIIE